MTLPKPGVSQTLARFVADTRWEDIPDPVKHEAKRALLNFFAVALAGCRTPPIEMALGSLAEFSGGKQATIVGRSERIDALNAAFLNAAGANVFDYCDTHLPTVVHPTAPLAPALLALSELRPVSGRDLLLAFVLGFEIECRVGGAVSPGHYPPAACSAPRRARRSSWASARRRSCGRWARPRRSRPASANA